MMARHGSTLLTIGLCAVVTACGSDGSDGSAGDAMVRATGGAGFGGGAGGSGTAGSPSGGTGPVTSDCTGAFGEPEPVFTDLGAQPQGISLTLDEREMFYFIEESGGTIPGRLVVRTRSSAAAEFGPPEDVAELAEVCPLPLWIGGVEVSHDGLRLYVSCEDLSTPDQPGPLRFAERSSRTVGWQLALEPIGMVGRSPGLSADERTLFSTVSRSTSLAVPPNMQTRSSLGDTFGTPIPVPGLPAAYYPSPDPSADGLHLFGGVMVETEAAPRLGLAVASRATLDAPFDPPTTTDMPAPAGPADGSPAISADCRRLYFVRVPQQGDRVVMMARR
jgi:hypothetical protein